MCKNTPKTVEGRNALDDTSLLGDHSEREPPDPIPNSEVKPLSADDSVAVCHAKVGNCQALTSKPKSKRLGFFLLVRLAVIIVVRACSTRVNAVLKAVKNEQLTRWY